LREDIYNRQPIMRKYQIALRLPTEVANWLKEQAALHGSSINSEMIRAVRERMSRVETDRK